MEEEKITSTDFKDNNIEWLNGDQRVTASFHNKRYINRIIKYAKQYPDEVDYKENQDGSIVCHFPLRYVKITRPAEREMTEEQKQLAAERFAKYREEQKIAREEDG